MTIKLPIKVSDRFPEAAPDLLINVPGYFRCDERDGTTWLTEWVYDIPLPSEADIAAAAAVIDWKRVRASRVALLDASDTIAVRCMKAGVPFPADWQAYTKALRDITKQEDPLNITWPSVPTIPVGV